MDSRDPKIESRKKRIRALIVAGYSIHQIQELCSFPATQIQEFFDTLTCDIDEEIKSRVKEIYFGHKSEAYYPPDLYSENDIIKLYSGQNKTGLNLDYSFEDLSEAELKFYQNQNKIHRHNSKFFSVAYLGINSDHRSNRWICTCQLCMNRFLQPTSLWSKKEIKCPECFSSEIVDFDDLKNYYAHNVHERNGNF